MFRSVSVYAAPSVDAAASPSTPLDPAYVVSVVPSSVLPAARPGRAIAAGTFPCWLVQTDNAGIELSRMLLTSSAPVYFSRTTGARWYVLAGAGVATANDVAFDVTYGDAPGDWLEYAGSSAAPLPSRAAYAIGQFGVRLPAGYTLAIPIPAGARGFAAFIDGDAYGDPWGNIAVNWDMQLRTGGAWLKTMSAAASSSSLVGTTTIGRVQFGTLARPSNNEQFSGVTVATNIGPMPVALRLSLATNGTTNGANGAVLYAVGIAEF